MTSPTPYPINLNLQNRPVLLVGAGPVAARKSIELLQAGAALTVVAPRAVPAIANHPNLRWHQRPYQRGEVASYRLALTATGHPEIDAQVHQDAEAAGIWVNSADDLPNCNYTLPAITRQGRLQITISTEGRSPAIATWLRKRLDQQIGAEHTALLDLAHETRNEMKTQLGSSESPGWAAALDTTFALLCRGQHPQARIYLRHAVGLDSVGLDQVAAAS